MEGLIINIIKLMSHRSLILKDSIVYEDPRIARQNLLLLLTFTVFTILTLVLVVGFNDAL